MGLLKQLGLFLLLTTCLWAQSGSSPKPQTGDTSEKGAASQPAPKTDASSPAASDASVSGSGDSTKLEPLKIQKAIYPVLKAGGEAVGVIPENLMAREVGRAVRWFVLVFDYPELRGIVRYPTYDGFKADYAERQC